MIQALFNSFWIDRHPKYGIEGLHFGFVLPQHQSHWGLNNVIRQDPKAKIIFSDGDVLAYELPAKKDTPIHLAVPAALLDRDLSQQQRHVESLKKRWEFDGIVIEWASPGALAMGLLLGCLTQSAPIFLGLLRTAKNSANVKALMSDSASISPRQIDDHARQLPSIYEPPYQLGGAISIQPKTAP